MRATRGILLALLISAVLNAPVPLGCDRSIPQISDQPCTRAHTGTAATIAAPAMTTV